MLDDYFFEKILTQLIQREFPNIFQARIENSHKGLFGSLGVIGGNHSMEGAVILAGQSALKMGCGKVFIAFSQNRTNIPYIVTYPEIMLRPYTDFLQDKVALQAVVIGCGLGTSSLSQEILQNSLIHFNVPMLLDADALNLLAQNKFNFNLSSAQHILTPHPREAARLLKVSVSEVQENRVTVAKQLASKYQATVVLKGFKTIVYSPLDDSIYINETGNSGLATAGTGDVLSGMIGSLLAQGYSISEAAKAGVFLHGLAADWLADQKIGPIGLTASEIIEAARYVRNYLTYHKTA